MPNEDQIKIEKKLEFNNIQNLFNLHSNSL